MKKINLVVILVLGGFFLAACGHVASSSSNQASTNTSSNGSGNDQAGPSNLLAAIPTNVGKVGAYVEYSPANFDQAVANHNTVLFFSADWCPTCRAAEKDIIKNIDNIPAGMVILKTNYDTQRELKKKYGVVVQHTFVQVDNNGELITMWNGGGFDSIISRTK